MKYYKHIVTPVGILKVQASDKGITEISVVETMVENSVEINEHITTCAKQLMEYFKGKRTTFEVSLDFGDAPTFYQDVWKTLMIIPYGRTRTYLDVATLLDNPKAVRAVGIANAKNPIPFVVPCHRVIGKNGSLVGYANGLKMKQFLLNLENPKNYNLQGVLFGNVA